MAAKVGPGDLNSLTLFGRFLTLFSLFGVATLGYLWNHRLGLSITLALLASTFYLALPVLIPWAVTARPDFPALFLCFLALYWIAFRSSAFSVALSAFFAATGFLVRHNAVAVPVAVVLWLLWSRRWKHALLFCVSWAFVVGSAFLPFELSAHGLLHLNLSSAKFGPFAFTYISDVLARLADTPGQGFIVALVAFGALGFLESWNRRDKRSQLLDIYLVVSLGLAIFGSAAAGAGINHYLEPALAMAVLVPVGVARLKEVWQSESPFSSFAVLIILALLLPSLDLQRSNLKHNRPEDLRHVLSLMENKQVFTDIPYLAARSSSPQSVDLSSLINTEKMGGQTAWSSAKLVEALEDKKYDLVILVKPVDEWPYDPAAQYPRAPRLDSAMQRAIALNYHLCFERDMTYVYSRVSGESKSIGDGCSLLERNVAPHQILSTADLTKQP